MLTRKFVEFRVLEMPSPAFFGRTFLVNKDEGKCSNYRVVVFFTHL